MFFSLGVAMSKKWEENPKNKTGPKIPKYEAERKSLKDPEKSR
jgi:hypothetical protein